MGHELGSQTIFKEKGNEITSIINGLFPEDELRKMLDKFFFNFFSKFYP